ncbi:MAG: hypothetical protein JOY62_02165 [Acidobacteriaceae bacterium]|nr:hypothetical protein [Acidobacteriaceae bacterium]MBV9778753.1 hypothetical protein [Acidobacteriaceae bacterium]
MGRQSINLPPDISYPLAMRLAPYDSGIHRGDREDTGDNQARPTQTGTGPAQPTVNPTSLGGASSIKQSPDRRFDADEELRDDFGMEVVEPTDGRLGLTHIGDVPADDWAADTGPDKSAESGS